MSIRKMLALLLLAWATCSYRMDWRTHTLLINIPAVRLSLDVVFPPEPPTTVDISDVALVLCIPCGTTTFLVCARHTAGEL
ncbi:uncharacterized protein UTRI_01459 [Ustilago trichophora]|uniref:Secreted protein n=1 Tax=Ustilago trichophora TaxID=86804 RepID=A0A5C3DZT1_9BASI|nr:uncharacterized protein UTRI_01459 [Ustilago trichophora]